MRISKVIQAGVLALVLLAVTAVSASANTEREFIRLFGATPPSYEKLEEENGIAVDLESGNVYVTNNRFVELGSPANNGTIDVFGPEGEGPRDGVRSELTDLPFNGQYGRDAGVSGIAIDNSCYEHEPRLTGAACEEYDPAYGDLYVRSARFNYIVAEGIAIYRKEPGGSNYVLVNVIPKEEAPSGLTVNAQGNIYAEYPFSNLLIEYKKHVEKIETGGVVEYKESYTEVPIKNLNFHFASGEGSLVVNGTGEIMYVTRGRGTAEPGESAVARVKLNAADEVVSEEPIKPSPEEGGDVRLAIDNAAGTVFVSKGPEVYEYNLAGTLLSRFGGESPLDGGFGQHGKTPVGLAVNGPAERVYVGSAAREEVAVYGGFDPPPVFAATQPPAEGVTRTSAMLAATVSPEGSQANWHFEYASAAAYEPGAVNPYAAGSSTPVVAFSGHAPVTLARIPLTGLSPHTLYHYRLVANNSTGTSYGPDETFTTSAGTPPFVTTGPALEVTPTSAVLTGIVNPRGRATSYVFELGTTTSYEGAHLYGNAGESTAEVPVQIPIQYLVEGVTYHYRLAATSFDGTTYGLDGTFTTPATGAKIAQPASEPLIANPTSEAFPSIEGAITEAVKPPKKAKKKTKHHHPSKKAKKHRHAGKHGSKHG